MTPTPLICPKCGKEIKPGDKVRIVSDAPPDARVIADDDAIVYHATCPEDDDGPAV